MARGLERVGPPPDPQPTPAQVNSNLRHLVWEISWHGIMVGTAINRMPVYVVRLGAPSLLVSAVTFGPALVGVLWQLPGAQLMNRTGYHMCWVLGTLFAHRAAYLLIALFPFVVSARLAELTVLLLFLQAIPLTMSMTSFKSMMADAMPLRQVASSPSEPDPA